MPSTGELLEVELLEAHPHNLRCDTSPAIRENGVNLPGVIMVRVPKQCIEFKNKSRQRTMDVEHGCELPSV